MFPLRSLHMFGIAAHWKSQIQNFTSSGTKAAGGWTPGRGPGWRSSLARPLREGQVESEIRRALGESMWLEAPQCADFFFEKQPRSNGNLLLGSSFLPFTCFHCRLCTCSELLSFEEPNSESHFACNKLPVGGPSEIRRA